MILWDFGDGSTGMGDDVQHTYLLPGRYTLTARAITVDGNDTETKIDYILVHGLVVVAKPDRGQASLKVQFSTEQI
jgi:PKD repeat protein